MQVKNTVFIGKVLLHFYSLPSTNAYAQELLSKSRPTEGTVILTANQTEGRGQIGSSWLSEPNTNLTFSLILYPHFLPIQRQFALSQAVALATRDFIAEKTSKTASVKWPNDIYINSKKVGGILIQNTLSGKKIQSSIIGIGLNVNQKQFSDSLTKASSLSIETGTTFDLETTLTDILQKIEYRYLQLRFGKLAQIQQDYLEHLYLYNQTASFCIPGEEPFKAKIITINQEGQLGLDDGASIRYFGIKEIQFLARL